MRKVEGGVALLPEEFSVDPEAVEQACRAAREAIRAVPIRTRRRITQPSAQAALAKKKSAAQPPA